jgi:hypothetical protein
VRRGDYTYLPKYDLRLFDKYYPTAIDNAQKENEDVFFYVLSNDLGWCTENSLFKNLYDEKKLEFVDCNEVIGLWLMQICAYGGICANSTYSWWGGWLNKINHEKNTPNKKNTVYFPSRIMNDDEDYTDLISSKFSVIKV